MEFGLWYWQLSPMLKDKLDELREECGVPIILSKDKGAIGRRLGKDDLSQHNVDKWGEVRAVDGYVPESMELLDFYNEAKGAGFTGIGFYTGWSKGRGFHLDVREDRIEGAPATWGGTYKNGKTTYGSIWAIIGTETTIG
jgi:hypothetical protein